MPVSLLLFLSLSLLLVSRSLAADPVVPTYPWGIHLAQGADPSTQMTIMWSTRDNVPGSIVTLSLMNGSSPWIVAGESWVFTDVSNTQTIHRVRVTSLPPGATYSYTVGDGNATSPAFSFKTPPYSHSPIVAVFGDMGVSSNAQVRGW